MPLTPPIPFPNEIKILVVLPLAGCKAAVAVSRLPSPLKSAATITPALAVVGKVFGPNLSKPLFNNTETSFEVLLVVAKSLRPSPLKLAIVTRDCPRLSADAKISGETEASKTVIEKHRYRAEVVTRRIG